MDKQYEVARSLNATMEQLKSITACGAECQKEKKSDGLKREYENILLDNENVSSRLHDARKNYFTYAFGERYYNDSEKDRINVLAEENVDKLRTKHNTLLRGIRDQKSEVKENKMAIERMNQLLNKVNASNEDMFNSVDNKESIVETSNRQVYYTMQKLSKVEFYRKIISTILKALMVIGIIYFSLYRKFPALAIIVIAYLLIRHFS